MAGVLSAFGKAPKNYGDVEFWHTPERTGWLMKQGVHCGLRCQCAKLHGSGRRRAVPLRHMARLTPAVLRTLWQPSLQLPVVDAAGEYIKTWRRRWFILKQGRIFWFKTEYVTPVRTLQHTLSGACIANTFCKTSNNVLE
jgi:hypothetical protein